MSHLLSFYFPGNDSYHVQNSQNADDNIFFKSVKKKTNTKTHTQNFTWREKSHSSGN